jgi:hypothetical protein
MIKKNYLFLPMIMLIFCFSLNAKSEKASLFNKTTFGIGYDLAISPKVSRFIATDDFSPLTRLDRLSLSIMYPYYRFLAVGASFDYTYILSNKDKDVRLSLSKQPAKISSQFLGVSAHIRPQWPIAFANTDLIFYLDSQLGLHTTSAITFGTQPLANYEFKNTNKMPTPFPLAFEVTPKIGVEIFAWRFVGLDLAFGYRTLWIVHPMVNFPDPVAGLPEEERKAVWNDVTSAFVQAAIKFAF